MHRSLHIVAIVAMNGCSAAHVTDSGLDAPDVLVAADAVDRTDTLALDAPVIDAAPDIACTAPPTDAAHGDGAACTFVGLPGQCIGVADCPGESVSETNCNARGVACCSVPADAGWCAYNGMPQPNAGLVEEPGDPGCPPAMVHVATYCVDRFEGSLAVVNGDGCVSPWSPYWTPLAGVRYRAMSLRGAVPQGYISGVDAAAACTEAGKRLCTDTEWLRACQGPTGTTYPYGNARMPGVCNDARAEHPAIQCFGTSDDWIWNELGYAGINEQAMTVDPTGSRTGCVTTEGAFDMMGNLHEWTSNPAGTFRGGYYVDTVLNGNGCLYATTAHDMTHWDYSTGFRCCADAM